MRVFIFASLLALLLALSLSWVSAQTCPPAETFGKCCSDPAIGQCQDSACPGNDLPAKCQCPGNCGTQTVCPTITCTPFLANCNNLGPPFVHCFGTVTSTGPPVSSLVGLFCIYNGASRNNFHVCNTGETTPPPIIVGDPQLTGFDGKTFQVHGIDGEVYSLLSAPFAHLNARFEFLGSKPAAVGTPEFTVFADDAANSTRTEKLHTQLWSHAGQYLGQTALRLRGVQMRDGEFECVESEAAAEAKGLRLPSKGTVGWSAFKATTSVISIEAVPGARDAGFSAVTVNNQQLKAGEGVTIALPLLRAGVDGYQHAICVRVFRESAASVQVSSPLLSLAFSNSDNFLNVDRLSLQRGMIETLLRVDVHMNPEEAVSGLIGATLPVEGGSDKQDVRRSIQDNMEANADVLGSNMPYNLFF